jgi:5-methylcytosine-specific restriction endonuclease McrA
MKRRKKSIRQKLKEKIDKEFSRIIRKRDKNVCQHCGVYKEDNRAMHVSHVIPKSKGLIVRWEVQNAMCLCFHCHFHFWHSSPLQASKWFCSKYPRRAAFLDGLDASPVKYSDYDLWGILEYLQGK